MPAGKKGGTRASGRVLAHFLRNVLLPPSRFTRGRLSISESGARIRQDVLLCWRFFDDDVLAPSWREIEGGNWVHVVPGWHWLITSKWTLLPLFLLVFFFCMQRPGLVIPKTACKLFSCPAVRVWEISLWAPVRAALASCDREKTDCAEPWLDPHRNDELRCSFIPSHIMWKWGMLHRSVSWARSLVSPQQMVDSAGIINMNVDFSHQHSRSFALFSSINSPRHPDFPLTSARAQMVDSVSICRFLLLPFVSFRLPLRHF